VETAKQNTAPFQERCQTAGPDRRCGRHFETL